MLPNTAFMSWRSLQLPCCRERIHTLAGCPYKTLAKGRRGASTGVLYRLVCVYLCTSVRKPAQQPLAVCRKSSIAQHWEQIFCTSVSGHRVWVAVGHGTATA